MLIRSKGRRRTSGDEGGDSMTTWLSATGQRWKLVVYGFLLALSAASVVLLILAFYDVGVARSVGVLRAALLVIVCGTVGMMWLCFAVRCRKCHGHPAWYLMRKAPIGRWIKTLISATQCPSCGDRPQSAATTDEPAPFGARRG